MTKRPRWQKVVVTKLKSDTVEAWRDGRRDTFVFAVALAAYASETTLPKLEIDVYELPPPPPHMLQWW